MSVWSSARPAPAPARRSRACGQALRTAAAAAARGVRVGAPEQMLAREAALQWGEEGERVREGDLSEVVGMQESHTHTHTHCVCV